MNKYKQNNYYTNTSLTDMNPLAAGINLTLSLQRSMKAHEDTVVSTPPNCRKTTRPSSIYCVTLQYR